MDPNSSSIDPGTDPGTDTALSQRVLQVRKRTIDALSDLIYERVETTEKTEASFQPEHDPALIRRRVAVEMLGDFPDDEAANVLAGLLLHGPRDIAPPAGRWLRDTALLALLRSNNLQPSVVNRALRHEYSILRHLAPWQWSEVYDDLPLLARYGKMRVFFRAFWLWPLLVFAIPTFIYIWPIVISIVAATSIDQLVSGNENSFVIKLILAVLAIVGIGPELYLIHQVVIALLAGRYGPLLQVPARATPKRKARILVILAGVVLCLLVLFTNFSGNSTTSPTGGIPVGPLAMGLIVVVLPLLLLPMFILAHDVELQVRYLPKGKNLRLRALAVIARRVTDLAYLILLPGLSLALLQSDEQLAAWLRLLWLGYLFTVPFIVAAGFALLTRLLARWKSTARPSGRPI